jgi:hypothetical protein
MQVQTMSMGFLLDVQRSLGETMEAGSPLKDKRQRAYPSGIYARMQSVLQIVQ